MNYYNILGVDQNASKEEIRLAYINLVKLHHPDVSNELNSNEIFNEITEAYNVLYDDEKRRIYDLYYYNTSNDFRTSSIFQRDAFYNKDFYNYNVGKKTPTGNSTLSKVFIRFCIFLIILILAFIMLKIFTKYM